MTIQELFNMQKERILFNKSRGYFYRMGICGGVSCRRECPIHRACVKRPSVEEGNENSYLAWFIKKFPNLIFEDE